MANKINDRRYSINNRWNKYPKQSLCLTIRQPYAFISWHHIRHVIEMAVRTLSQKITLKSAE